MERGQKGSGARGQGSTEVVGSVDDLFQLPLDQFTAARNAFASKLKKAGKGDEAAAVKTLTKPPVSAWAVNQLYWRHRTAFDELLSTGEEFRKAQAAQLGGKTADLRGTLDARRQALAALSRLAADLLQAAGHTPGPDTMRRLTTTLEALATLHGVPEAPRGGYLTGDVDPPGFEALAALIPRVGGAAGNGEPRLLTFRQQKKPPAPKPKKETPEETQRREEEERRAREAAAKAAVQEAEKTLREARKDAEQAEGALKKAAALAKDTEKERAALEKEFEKVVAAADSARQDARRVAEEAETAAEAVEDAERELKKAKKLLADAHLA